MAHYEQSLSGDVEPFIAHLDQVVLGRSVTAKQEDAADHRIGDARMVVRVYERYSAMGGNRVSLSVAVLCVGAEMSVTAITSGGSQAMFFKINTLGEEAFLQKAVEAIQGYAA